MKANVSLKGNTTVTLNEALLIYREQNSERSYITRHVVHEGVCGPAMPLTVDFVADLAESLGTGAALEILPPNVLVRTPDTIVWWTKAQKRTMFFSGDRTTDAEVNGKSYPQPPLVWMANGSGLSVRALKTEDRPDAMTPMCVAPYWNTYESGDICLGSMPRPETRSVAAIYGWEDAFFASSFTHPNTPKLVQSPLAYIDFIARYANGDRFPVECLIDADQTLSDFIKEGR